MASWTFSSASINSPRGNSPRRGQMERRAASMSASALRKAFSYSVMWSLWLISQLLVKLGGIHFSLKTPIVYHILDILSMVAVEISSLGINRVILPDNPLVLLLHRNLAIIFREDKTGSVSEVNCQDIPLFQRNLTLPMGKRPKTFKLHIIPRLRLIHLLFSFRELNGIPISHLVGTVPSTLEENLVPSKHLYYTTVLLKKQGGSETFSVFEFK